MPATNFTRATLHVLARHGPVCPSVRHEPGNVLKRLKGSSFLA